MAEGDPEHDVPTGGHRGAARAVVAVLLIAVVLAWQADVFTPKIRAGEIADSRSVIDADEIIEVERWTETGVRRLPASLAPRARIELSSRIAGQIEAVRVEEGDTVSRGETLVLLDSDVPQAARDAAASAVTVAQAELSGAERLLESIAEAVDAGSLSETERIDAERARDAAAARLEQASAELAGAEARLSFTRVVSPISGVIEKRLQDGGDRVLPGQPLLLLYQPERLEIVVDVPESLAPRFLPGSPVTACIQTLERCVEGVVRIRVPSADPATRSVRARVAADLPAAALPGQFVRVHVDDPTSGAGVPVVPSTAVEQVRQIPFVWVVDDERRALRRVVRLGRTVGDRVTVLAGLEGGDRVVRDARALEDRSRETDRRE